jgi:ABC-type glutathione transport system ATPase component
VEEAAVLEIVLKGINMEVHRGDLAVVVGTVGSGKASLLSRIMGEMDKVSGKVSLCYFLCKTDILVYQNSVLFAHLFGATFLFLKNYLCAILKDKCKVFSGLFCNISKVGCKFSAKTQLRFSSDEIRGNSRGLSW